MGKYKLILVGILLVSAVLHFWRIGLPAKPVFDEAHFATYALDYAKGVAHTDIHPPVGKILYAGVLFLSGRNLSDVNGFLNISRDSGTGRLAFSASDVFYGNYPYILLRSLSVLFGLLLVILVYLFAKNIGFGELGALFSAALTALDNALLLDTRLILLNGMYLCLGLYSLILFFRKPHKSFLPGIVWGLCLSVKLLGILFLGPVLFSVYRSGPEERRKVMRFIFTGIAVLLLSFCLNWLFFSPENQVRAWQELGIFSDLSVSGSVSKPYLFTWLMYPFIDIAGYTVASSALPSYPAAVSRWYEWPIMQKPMPLFWQPGSGLSGTISLTGNPVVWFLALTGILFTLFGLVRKFIRKTGSPPNNMLPHILSGYFFALLPFIFISRTSFLYHYYPALLFGIIIAGYWLGRFFNDLKNPRRRIMFLCVFALVLFASFAWSAPATYGLRPWLPN